MLVAGGCSGGALLGALEELTEGDFTAQERKDAKFTVKELNKMGALQVTECLVTES